MSGERHRQCLTPWSLPTPGEQNNLLLCLVPPTGDAVRILFLVSIERGALRRVRHRRLRLSEESQIGGAPLRFLAAPAVACFGCRRTEARKRREKRLAGPRNSNSKLFVCVDPNQLRIIIQNPPASGRAIDPNLRHDACRTDSDLTAGVGARIGVRTGGPARRDTPGCSG